MAAIPKVLVISDQPGTSPLWGSGITQRFQFVLEPNPNRAVQNWMEILPDLVVLELESEPLAIALIARFREEATTPVLMLSSNCAHKFMLDTYQAGVDEYILKPIHPALFHAKLKAWLRRSWSVPYGVLEPLKVGSVKLVPTERRILFGDRDPVHLTSLELRLLYYLMGRHGHTVTTEDLCQRIWGETGGGDVMRLKNVVYRLRRKIEADPAKPFYLRTVTGAGYQFNPK
jgi:two-component system KDP operon response regulator KdpE